MNATRERHSWTRLVAIAAWLFWSLASVPSIDARAATIDVPQQYSTIQAAIDNAVPADVIRVAPGVYFENIDFRGKHLTIEGTGGASVTTIDGRYGGSTVTMSARSAAMILRGLTIRNGGGSGGPGWGTPLSNGGGGVRVSGEVSARLHDCIVTGNRAAFGGGVYIEGGFLTLERCRIHANTATNDGGGVVILAAGSSIRESWIHDNAADDAGGGIKIDARTRLPLVKTSTIERNVAHRGGGIYVVGDARIADNRILDNVVDGNGGGISCDSGPSTPIVEDNLLAGNRARSGGGISTGNSTATIRRNTLIGNHATYGGGANLFSWGEYPATFEDNLVTQNRATRSGGGLVVSDGSVGRFFGNAVTRNRAPRGGGIFVDEGNPRLESSTISENVAGQDGGGIQAEEGSPWLVDCELYGNEAFHGGAISVLDSAETLVIERCKLWGNRAEGQGGAVAAFGLTSDESHISSSVFLDNDAGESGGAIELAGVTVLHCTGVTFARNTTGGRGGAIAAASAPVHIVNSIAWMNLSESSSPFDGDSGQMTVRFSIVQGGWPGPGNSSVDPRLVFDGAGDARLSIASPCIDAGRDGEPYAGELDIDGDPRRLDGSRDGENRVDIGADESVPEHAARYGGVGTARGTTEAIVAINSSTGSAAEREVFATAGTPIQVAVQRPSSGGSGAFVLHANFGEPKRSTLVDLPLRVGTMGFPLLVNQGATPDAIWNAIGNPFYLGSSRYFDGSPLPAPQRAPTVLLDLPAGDDTHLPVGTIVTFQGLVHDRGSIGSVPISVTNAVVLRIE